MVMIKRTAVLAVVIGSLCGIVQADKPAAKSATKDSKAVATDVNTNVAATDVTITRKADAKVGYVNVPEAMQSSKRGTEIAASLEKKRQELTADIKKVEANIIQAVNEIKSKESTMSSSARNAEEAKMVKMRREHESLIKESEEQLKLAMQQASEELTVEIEKTAAEIAKREGYKLVVDVFSGRTIYAETDALITADLIKAMDKKYEVAHTAKKPATSTAA